MGMVLVGVECPSCRKTDEFEVDERGYNRWRSGTHIQNAFPDLNVDRREQLMSGICPPCWDAEFPSED